MRMCEFLRREGNLEKHLLLLLFALTYRNRRRSARATPDKSAAGDKT